MIRDAAAATGESLTEFVTTAAVTRAEDTLAGRSVFRLGDAAWSEFNAILDRPAQRIPSWRDCLTSPPPGTSESPATAPIEATDNTTGFVSGEESLDRYLAVRAGRVIEVGDLRP
ncbi:MAG: DUF1778 domain-containing protein [Actinobacteria bacterium]|nr:DUF1778 domain-containing protein [Actinomycetota bacterium]